MIDFTEKLAKATVEYYRSGWNLTQRFGQFFCNNYLPDEYLPWPDLFYESDTNKAIDILFSRFALDNVKALE